MESVLIQARFPSAVVEEIDKLVKAGIYRNRSEALRDSARMVLREQRGILKTDKSKSSTQIIREIRKKMWTDALKKAGGDKKKAAHLIIKEANKIEL